MSKNPHEKVRLQRKFKVGTRVKHKKFGVGVVLNIDVQDTKRYVDIEFRKSMVKTLNVDFLEEKGLVKIIA